MGPSSVSCITPIDDVPIGTVAFQPKWLAIDEIEHEAVACDVLQATHPGYGLRIAGFLLASVTLWEWTIAGMRMLLRQDGLPRAEQARQRCARDDGRLLRRAGRNLRAYFRRDFHPSQIDDMPLARTRLPEIGDAAP
ncbi:MAG: metal-dependent hydrolase [Myxococcota bacterium]|nr:metal-dependent hydrolase [Myxococcota bacterium]